jgi:hypothetical protein
MTTSNRLGITEMAEAQNNRSVTVNEAIAILEAVGGGNTQAVSVGDNAPPGSPAEGDVYVVGTAGTGAFSGHNKAIAIYYNAAWIFVAPLEGFKAYDQTSDTKYLYDGSAWSAEASALAKATTAQVRAATADKALTADNVYSAAAEVTLADAATVAVDMATFINGVVTLAGNRTLGQPSNTKVGQSGVIRIVQDGTGSRTLAYHADWKFAGGVDPTLSTAAGAEDLLFYQVIGANKIYANLVKAIG